MPQTKAATQPTVQPIEDSNDTNVKLYEELGELARFIDTTMRTLSEFSVPVSSTTEQLPQAMTHLTDLKLLTERGTHEVMRQVEAMQENHARIAAALKALLPAMTKDSVRPQVEQLVVSLEGEDKRLTDIMTALSFQDIVAQRVNKLATILGEVEHKLLQLVVVFGPYKKQVAQLAQDKTTQMLKQLEAAKSTAMDQNLADEILKEFGFN